MGFARGEPFDARESSSQSDTVATVDDAEKENEHSTRERARALREQVKLTTKRLFGQGEDKTPSSDDESENENIFSDAAFNPAKILDESPPKPSKTSLTGKFKQVASVTAHPRRAMRHKATKTAAGKIGSGKQPVTSIAGDREFIDAHDALARAKATSKPSSAYGLESDTEDSDVGDARERVRTLQAKRESLQTAWVLARHVDRVKAVTFDEKPRREDFSTLGDAGRFEWERYLGKMAIYHSQSFTARYVDDFSKPPFDLRDLARIIERLAITSAPLQAFVIDVRRVYRWENPRKTFGWALLFWTLWYRQYIGSYLFAWVIYSTLRNRFKATSVEDIRNSVKRGVDREAKAQAWGEIIRQHGKNEWIEPLLDEVGPLIQMQLGDLANFLEVLLNFYRHERPAKTGETLFYFSVCLLITLTTDMACCMKIFWFTVGCWFFFGFPLSVRFPKYRLLCSWPRWIFWDIPTHAELAIMRLQEKAVLRDVRRATEDPDASKTDSYNTDNSDYLSCDSAPRVRRLKLRSEQHSFQAHDHDHHRLQLIVARHGISVRTKSGSRRSYPYYCLSEMRKIDTDSKLDRIVSLQSNPRGLQFTWRSGTGFEDLRLVVRAAEIDRIFNLILGWSGLKWQALQMERHQSVEEDRSRLDKTLQRAVG